MHVCHLLLKQPVQALLVLQGIPAKLRSVKVNMALGKLYLFLQYFFLVIKQLLYAKND